MLSLAETNEHILNIGVPCVPQKSAPNEYMANIALVAAIIEIIECFLLMLQSSFSFFMLKV